MKKIITTIVMCAAVVSAGSAVLADSSTGDMGCHITEDDCLSAELSGGNAGIAFVGLYSDGRLIEVHAPEMTENAIYTKLENIDAADTIKTFFWENGEGMKPVASYTIELAGDGAIGNAIEHPSMIVSDVSIEKDEDGNDVAVISGYSEGIEYKYNITSRSAVYSAESVVLMHGEGYNVKKIWGPAGSDDTVQGIESIISAGDLVIADDPLNTTTLVRLIRSDDAEKNIAAAWTESIWHGDLISEGWIYGESVSKDETGDQVLISFDGENKFAIDAEYSMDLYDMTDPSGVPVIDTISIDELNIQDAESNVRDILVLQTYHGQISSAYVYRLAE